MGEEEILPAGRAQIDGLDVLRVEARREEIQEIRASEIEAAVADKAFFLPVSGIESFRNIPAYRITAVSYAWADACSHTSGACAKCGLHRGHCRRSRPESSPSPPTVYQSTDPVFLIP